MMKAHQRKPWPWIIGIGLILAAGIAFVLVWNHRADQREASNPYQNLQPQVQALSVTVNGDGYVRSKDRYSFYAQAPATIESVRAEEGERIAAGGIIATLRSDELNAQIGESLESLHSLMEQAERVSLSKSTRSLSAPAKGRVKWMVSQGGNLAQIQETYGAIGYIAPEKKMQVSIESVGLLQVGQVLTVQTGQGQQSGKVTRTDTPDGRAVIQLEDDSLPIQSVQVLSQDGQILGEGRLLPVGGIPILAGSGIVDTLDAKENDQVTKGEKLLTLEEDYSEETQQLFASLRQAQDAHEVLLARQRALVLRAPFDCILTTCDIHEGESVTQGTVLASLISEGAFEVVAAIDEMDIASIEPGQAATVTFDAVQGKTLEATVQRKSTAGVHENGVTTFDVFLDLAPDPLILSGMSADVVITVTEHTQALTVPKTAIVYQGNDPYVRTAEGMVPVTLGAIQGDAVEVLSGLDAHTTVWQEMPGTRTEGDRGGAP